MTFTEFAGKNGIIWLSPKLAAKLMQCSIEHIYDLAKSGEIAYIQDGRNVRFRPEDLDAYCEKHYCNANGEGRRRYGSFQEKRQ